MKENNQKSSKLALNSEPSRTNKYLKYAILPAFAFALIGAGTASANGWGMFGGNNASPEEVAQSAQDRFQHEAELLGLSVDKVKAGWAQGETLFQIAEENGITPEQLQEKMQAERQQRMQEHLQALVDSGVITQQQADQRQEFMRQQQQNGRGFGHYGKRGMMKPF